MGGWVVVGFYSSAGNPYSSIICLLRDTFNFYWVRNGLPVYKNGCLQLGRFFPDLVQCITVGKPWR